MFNKGKHGNLCNKEVVVISFVKRKPVEYIYFIYIALLCNIHVVKEMLYTVKHNQIFGPEQHCNVVKN